MLELVGLFIGIVVLGVLAFMGFTGFFMILGIGCMAVDRLEDRLREDK